MSKKCLEVSHCINVFSMIFHDFMSNANIVKLYESYAQKWIKTKCSKKVQAPLNITFFINGCNNHSQKNHCLTLGSKLSADNHKIG